MTNRHSVRILFLLLTWAAHLRPLLGQEPVATPHIDVAERYDFGAKIDPKFVGTALEGATAVYAWTLPEGMESERDDGPFPLLWAGKAKQGVQKISLSVTYTIQLPQIDPSDPTKLITKPFTLPPYRYEETFVLGAVPPGPIPDPEDPDTPAPTTTATAATYVYEKNQSVVPPAVMHGLNRLNRERKIFATLYEQDSTDGDNDVPDQYKVPLAAARKAGLPALVITSKSEVLKVVKDPRTEAQVFEAIAP